MREDQLQPDTDEEETTDATITEASAASEPVEDEIAEPEPYDDIGDVEGETEMRDMIGYIARVLVDDTDAVQVTSNWSDGRLNINLKVADDDKGKVIGRRGRVVHAMQSLLRVAVNKVQHAGKHRRRINFIPTISAS